MSLTHDQKRAFIHKIIEVLEENQQALNDAGFDVADRLIELNDAWALEEDSEAKQIQAMAASKAATEKSNTDLAAAYNLSSATVELIVGILGKDHPLVEVLKNVRDLMILEAQRGKKKPDEEKPQEAINE